MGLLTNQERAQGFSTFVTTFGLALLIASGLYLQRLERFSEKHNCQNDNSTLTHDHGHDHDLINEPCDALPYWRLAAYLGILVGFITVLIIPFICCNLICTNCGCYLCLCLLLGQDTGTGNREQYKPEPLNINVSTVEADVETGGWGNVRKKKTRRSRYDPATLPHITRTWMNFVGWTIFVGIPLLGTAIIPYTLYHCAAIRTEDEKLYSVALSLFVIALLNFMLYFQIVTGSVCRAAQNAALGKKKTKSSVLQRLQQIHSQHGNPARKLSEDEGVDEDGDEIGEKEELVQDGDEKKDAEKPEEGKQVEADVQLEITDSSAKKV